MDDYKIIVEQDHSTVMAHYEVEPKPAEGYQSSSTCPHGYPVPTATNENGTINTLNNSQYTYAEP
jgi:hypothetical protein